MRSRITPEGLRQLITLPTKIRDAALVVLSGSIGENPQRSGEGSAPIATAIAERWRGLVRNGSSGLD
jgi:hypothetical protein